MEFFLYPRPPAYRRESLDQIFGDRVRYTLSIGHDVTWKPTTSELSPDSFDETISNHRLAVLHFWAHWNEYDKQMDVTLGEIEAEYDGRVFFGSVDADRDGHWQKCRELGIVNLPAIASFANGKHIETLIGMRTKEELTNKMKEWITAARLSYEPHGNF